MMRKHFIVAACLAGFGGTSARAQIAVTDLGLTTQQIKEYVQDAKAYALQAQQYVTQGQQLLQLVQTFNAFVQNPNLGAAVGLMGQAGLGNDLPINPVSLMSITSGYNMSLSNLAGKLAMLSSLAGGAYTQNHVYTCTNQSWTCQQQQQRAYGLAGTSGIAQSAYQNLRNHMPVIQALRDQASTATTPAQRENVALALQSETAWNNNLAAQVSAADMQARSDEASRVQQDNEKTSQAVEQTIAGIPQ